MQEPKSSAKWAFVETSTTNQLRSGRGLMPRLNYQPSTTFYLVICLPFLTPVAPSGKLRRKITASLHASTSPHSPSHPRHALKPLPHLESLLPNPQSSRPLLSLPCHSP